MSDLMRFEKSRAFSDKLEKLVPGGAHTYSKGRDQFPSNSPNGIIRGKGALIWDQDDNELIDWGMGLTSVSIGHAYDPVDTAVYNEIRKGVNFIRPAEIELHAAEFILNKTGIDGMVKFAKHGSTVTTAAVKLARAYTGKSLVACPFEHPFFSFDDWFIGSTPSNFGTLKSLNQYIKKFKYGDMDSLKSLFNNNKNEIACVIMEPLKFHHPQEGYLNEAREVCHQNGALFIIDEMVSGAKWGVGGGQAKLNIEADLSTWGKGIANGYACAALIGRSDIMRLGGIEKEQTGKKKMFLISTTHGAESSGLAAMMKTLDEFDKKNMASKNWLAGTKLRKGLVNAISNSQLNGYLNIIGDPCLLALENFNSNGEPDAGLRTYFFQELIARGICSQGIFLPTVSHTTKIIERTVRAFSEACQAYSDGMKYGLKDKLIGPAIKPVFRAKI